jgi:hypothetical protein
VHKLITHLRRAVNGVWQPAVRLWKAERETPIAATMLSDSKIMHVFFQVGNNIVVYLGSFDGDWYDVIMHTTGNY